MHLQPVLTLPLGGETKCECCTLTPLLTPFFSKPWLANCCGGYPQNILFNACTRSRVHMENCLHTRPLLKMEDLEAVVGCPVLRARTLAEAKQGLAGACGRGGGEVSDPPHMAAHEDPEVRPGTAQGQALGVSNVGRGCEHVTGTAKRGWAVYLSSAAFIRGKKTQRGRFSSGGQTCGALYS